MRKFGKRFMGAVLVAALTATMSMSVFAAKNPSASNTSVVSKATATDKNGNEVEVVVSETDQSAADEVKSEETLKELLGDAYVEGMEVVDVVDVSVKGEGEVEFPLTITFEVPGVLSTTDVAVLHKPEGGNWQVEPSKAGKGTITATFDSLSPVAFVINKNNGVAGSTSPKTGETATAGVVAVLAVVAAAGAYTFRKKTAVR